MGLALSVSVVAALCPVATAYAQQNDLPLAELEGVWFRGDSESTASPRNFYVYLEGELARELYGAMAGPGLYDECRGGTTKRVGEEGLECNKSEADVYECLLAIDYLTGQLMSGLIDC